MRIDPTQPLYETRAIEHKETPEQKLIKEVCSFLLLTNPQNSYVIKDDFTMAYETMAHYTLDVLKEAFLQLKSLSKTTSCDFGHYYKLASDVVKHRQSQAPAYKPPSDPNDWRERNMQIAMRQSEREKEIPKSGIRASRYWLKYIRTDLAQSGTLVKPLPYDKKVKV